jgi:hypothetical protein
MVPLLGVLLVAVVLGLTIATQIAEAASAPTAYTGEAGQLTTSSATLQGSVYPGDQATSYYFQYGPTAAYGSQTPAMTIGGGTQTLHVTAPVTGLAVYSTYYFRLVAVNASGTALGHYRAFMTKKVPLTFDLEALSDRDPFGQPFSVQGTLSGTGSAGHAIVLQANPFPYLAGFKAIGNPALTNADGGFSFSVPGLLENSQLRVETLETPPVNSHVIVELVQVRVTLNLRATGRPGYARLYGTVTPAQAGAVAGFQLLRRGRKPLGTGSTLVAGRGVSSHFGRVVRIRHAGLYRVHVVVASGAQVSSYSRVILIR